MDTYNNGALALCLFCVICDKDKQKKVIAAMEEVKAFFSLVLRGKGTGSSKILAYLGLDDTEKAVLFSILLTKTAQQLQEKLNKKMDFVKPGNGIVFQVPVIEGCYHKPVHLTQEDGGNVMQQPATQNQMLMLIMNRGYTEDVMEEARANGATGGTVLHGRGCGLAGAEKFFGVTIQPEKDVIIIVAGTDTCTGIMQAVAKKYGPETAAGAVSFSLPVSGVCGVGLDVPAGAV